ncbi:MAG: helicase-related protein [Pseudomonadota bacterium]
MHRLLGLASLEGMNAPLGMARRGRLVAVLGPTNTGKTHLAVERMLAHASGMMGFPLRLLAREVYDRVVAIKGASRVALITGEEKIVPPYADYFLCTAEAMPLGREVAFLALDEVQMCADPERGHVFTERLLHARGSEETMLLGADTMRPLLRRILPQAEFIARPRFSQLRFVSPKKLSRLPRRTAVVAFSAEEVYAHAELLRRQKGGAAIVMGALSPRTRNAQVAMYQSGEVDYLVATDAIGMGLNMDIETVAFAATAKFDGRRHRALTPAELGQVAGRAGRHMADGGFSAIAGTPAAGLMTPDLIKRIEGHCFEAVEGLYWRAHRLDFSSLSALIASLEARPQGDGFVAAREAEDLAVLKALAVRPKVVQRLGGASDVALLWETCQIPDFRKIALDVHARLVEQIFLHLSAGHGVLPEAWMRRQIEPLDNTQGDIDTLAARIAGIRIWTYVSHRQSWLERPEQWAALTRAIEDKLSDALHARLTQRFVDRRTTALLRELRTKGEWMVNIEPAGTSEEVVVEGHAIGRLEGFVFHAEAGAAGEDAKMLRAAGERGLRREVELRARALSAAGDGEFALESGHGLAAPRVKWRGAAVAEVLAGDDILLPRLRLVPGTMLDGPLATQVQERLAAWLRGHVTSVLAPLMGLREVLRAQARGAAEVALGGQARAVAYRLVEALGVLPREDVDKEVRALDQVARRGLRQFGIRFGASYIFMPPMLKPAPTDLRLTLWRLRQKDGMALPARPAPGLVWVDVADVAAPDYYRVAGFRVVGAKAVRIDMLERLSDAVRPLGQGGKAFAVGPDLMGLVGCAGDDFIAVMRALGYGVKQAPREALAPPQPEPAETAACAPALGEEAPGETPSAPCAPQPPREAPREGESALMTAFFWQPRHKPATRPRGGKPQASPPEGKKRDSKQKARRKPARIPTVMATHPAPAHSPFAALAALKKTMKSE